MPFFHSYGLVVMNEAVSFGCTMVLLPNPSGETIIKATDTHKVTHFPLIPRLIREVLSHYDPEKHDLSSITTCSSGGAAISIDLMQDFEEITDARMYQGYGLTEAGPIIAATPVEGDPNYASTGLPYPDTEIKIMDLQVGEIEMPHGKDGEIVVKGPQLMKGYYKDSETTVNFLKEGWLYTGDIGKYDENGYLYIVGRKKDRIISNGRTVWPTKVEEVLESHPSVDHAVAFGVPDPLRCSTDIRAIVVPKGNEKLERELVQLCTEELEEYMVPTRITSRETLPLTVMGKVDRLKIAEEIEKIINKAMKDGKIPEKYL
jgi:long-chain acyl-CoA synthetase